MQDNSFCLKLYIAPIDIKTLIGDPQSNHISPLTSDIPMSAYRVLGFVFRSLAQMAVLISVKYNTAHSLARWRNFVTIPVKWGRNQGWYLRPIVTFKGAGRRDSARLLLIYNEFRRALNFASRRKVLQPVRHGGKGFTEIDNTRGTCECHCEKGSVENRDTLIDWEFPFSVRNRTLKYESRAPATKDSAVFGLFSLQGQSYRVSRLHVGRP